MVISYNDVVNALSANNQAHPIIPPNYDTTVDGNALAGLIGRMMYLRQQEIVFSCLSEAEQIAFEKWGVSVSGGRLPAHPGATSTLS